MEIESYQYGDSTEKCRLSSTSVILYYLLRFTIVK